MTGWLMLWVGLCAAFAALAAVTAVVERILGARDTRERLPAPGWRASRRRAGSDRGLW